VGRTLLLADDSITIQKIVALTFAEEGIEVIAVSDGAQALEKLEETSPDIVLADVFMPHLSGYQVCEHIKQTERFSHIPVLLMVGSFEPFDEAEARRVGADDILSKPFQSIRTLMDKVGVLLGREPSAPTSEEPTLSTIPEAAVDAAPFAETVSDFETRTESPADADEADTQELPPPEVVLPPEEPMSMDEIRLTTADTQRLSMETKGQLEHLQAVEVPVVQTLLEAEKMPTNLDAEVNTAGPYSFDDGLLEVEGYDSAGFDYYDEIVLDIDFDAAPPAVASAMVADAPQMTTSAAVENKLDTPASSPAFSPAAETGAQDIALEPETASREDLGVAEPVDESVSGVGATLPAGAAALLSADSAPAPGMSPAGLITLDQLAPEVVDAIARRVVEQMSEKAVQEIAWEVVPQLSELMIKRRLEEEETKSR